VSRNLIGGGVVGGRGEIANWSYRTGTFGDNEPDEIFKLIQIGGDGIAAAKMNLKFET